MIKIKKYNLINFCYLLFLQTFFVVGPAIGYILGGYFLEIYTDFDQGPTPQMLNSDSPLWVGAWWFGFMISFASSISCAVFIGKSTELIS